MKPTPEQIIEAFDEILDYVYGRSRGRDYPGKQDIKFAEEWIAEGLTVPIASVVFYDRMRVMHERWLRQAPNDRTAIPQGPGHFDENIRTALVRVKAGGDPIAAWEQTLSQWGARISSWVKDPLFWRRMIEQWGEEPSHPHTRAPANLIKELVPPALMESRKKTDDIK